MGTKWGNNSTPSVCDWTNKTPFTDLFMEERTDPEQGCSMAGVAKSGILLLSPVIFQGPLLAHPADTLIQWADSHCALRSPFQQCSPSERCAR